MTFEPNGAPLQGFAGGLMIGCAIVIMLFSVGRIPGAGGLAERATRLVPRTKGLLTAVIFMIGLAIGVSLVYAPPLKMESLFTAPLLLLILSGLLAGFGIWISYSSKSGQGIYGISLLSPRNLGVAAIFIGVAIATVEVMRILGVAP
jgi:hypothetical protein